MHPKGERPGQTRRKAFATIPGLTVRPTRLYCYEHRVEFDVGTRGHALCLVTAKLPSLRKLEAATAAREAQEERVIRHSCGYAGVDRVFGGGLSRGSCALLTGKAGLGKSTLLLQMLMAMAAAGATVVYVSGEETRAQVMERARGIGEVPPNLIVISTNSWEHALRFIEHYRPHIIVVDSIQRLATIRVGDGGRGGRPGSNGQVVNMAGAIKYLCKDHPRCWSPIVIAIGHLNAKGDAAGPEGARHDMDTLLHLAAGDAGKIHLMSGKNRYGPSGEIATFRFQGKRMIELADLSTSLLDGVLGAPGAVAFPSAHLARIVIAPIEAVVASLPGDGTTPGPRVWRATGSLTNIALTELLEALRSHGDVDCSARDVKVEVPRIADEPMSDNTIDAAVACAILSSAEARTPAPGTAYFGKLSLSGKMKPPDRVWDRLLACHAGGIRRVYGPLVDGNAPPVPDGMEYVAVSDLRGLVDAFRRDSPVRITPRSAQTEAPPVAPKGAAPLAGFDIEPQAGA